MSDQKDSFTIDDMQAARRRVLDRGDFYSGEIVEADDVMAELQKTLWTPKVGFLYWYRLDDGGGWKMCSEAWDDECRPMANCEYRQPTAAEIGLSPFMKIVPPKTPEDLEHNRVIDAVNKTLFPE